MQKEPCDAVTRCLPANNEKHIRDQTATALFSPQEMHVLHLNKRDLPEFDPDFYFLPEYQTIRPTHLANKRYERKW